MGAEKKTTSKPPIYEERWFEAFVLLGCLGLGWLFWEGLDTASPIAQLGSQSVDSMRVLAMVRQLLEGQWTPLFYEAQLPPLYPVMLAGLAGFFEVEVGRGTSGLMALIPLAKSLNFYLYLASILLVNAFVRSRLDRPVSFLVTALYTIAPITVGTSFLVSPKMTYIVSSMAVLVLVDRGFEKAEEGTGTGKLLWAFLGLMLGLTILALPIGYMLLFAFLIACIRKLNLKKSLLPIGIALLLSLPFLIRDGYYEYEPNIRTQGWGSVVPAMEQARQQVTDIPQPRAQIMADTSIRSVLGEFHWGESRLSAADIPWVRWTTLTLTILGLAYGLWHASGIGSLYVLFYLSYMLAFAPPQSLSGLHMFTPLLPLLLMYLYLGLLRLGTWLGHMHLPISKVTVPVLSTMLVFSAVSIYVHSTDFLELPSINMPQSMPGAPIASTGPIKPLSKRKTSQKPRVAPNAKERAQQWLNQNAPPGALIGHANEAMLSPPRPRSAVPTGMNEPPTPLQSMLGLDYIVEEPGTPEIQRTFKQLLSQARGRFQLVYQDTNSDLRIWRVTHR